MPVGQVRPALSCEIPPASAASAATGHPSSPTRTSPAPERPASAGIESPASRERLKTVTRSSAPGRTAGRLATSIADWRTGAMQEKPNMDNVQRPSTADGPSTGDRADEELAEAVKADQLDSSHSDGPPEETTATGSLPAPAPKRDSREVAAEKDEKLSKPAQPSQTSQDSSVMESSLPGISIDSRAWIALNPAPRKPLPPPPVPLPPPGPPTSGKEDPPASVRSGIVVAASLSDLFAGAGLEDNCVSPTSPLATDGPTTDEGPGGSRPPSRHTQDTFSSLGVNPTQNTDTLSAMEALNHRQPLPRPSWQMSVGSTPRRPPATPSVARSGIGLASAKEPGAPPTKPLPDVPQNSPPASGRLRTKAGSKASSRSGQPTRRGRPRASHLRDNLGSDSNLSSGGPSEQKKGNEEQRESIHGGELDDTLPEFPAPPPRAASQAGKGRREDSQHRGADRANTSQAIVGTRPSHSAGRSTSLNRQPGMCRDGIQQLPVDNLISPFSSATTQAVGGPPAPQNQTPPLSPDDQTPGLDLGPVSTGTTTTMADLTSLVARLQTQLAAQAILLRKQEHELASQRQWMRRYEQEHIEALQAVKGGRHTASAESRAPVPRPQQLIHQSRVHSSSSESSSGMGNEAEPPRRSTASPAGEGQLGWDWDWESVNLQVERKVKECLPHKNKSHASGRGEGRVLAVVGVGR